MVICIQNYGVQEWSNPAKRNCDVFSSSWEVGLVDHFSPVDSLFHSLFQLLRSYKHFALFRCWKQEWIFCSSSIITEIQTLNSVFLSFFLTFEHAPLGKISNWSYLSTNGEEIFWTKFVLFSLTSSVTNWFPVANGRRDLQNKTSTVSMVIGV